MRAKLAEVLPGQWFDSSRQQISGGVGKQGWNRLGAVLLLLAVVAGCSRSPAKVVSSPAEVVRGKVEAIQRGGNPGTLEELNRAYAAPPAEQDGTAFLEQAFQRLTKDDPKSAAFLANHRQVLPLLREAAARGRARFPVNLTRGQDTQLPHLASLKKCVQILVAEAVHQAGLGQSEPATRALLDAVAIARTLESEPLVISQLVRVSGESLAVDGLAQVLTRRALGEADLVKLQQAFLAAEQGSSMAGALIGERCMGLHLYGLPPDALTKTMTATESAESKLGLQPGEMEKYVASAKFKQDLEFYLDIMEGFIRLSREPFATSRPELEQLAGRASEGPGQGLLIAGRFLPALRQSIDRQVAGVARLRLARVAAAVERHRLAHENAVPTSLAELVPVFLEAAPTDPFDDKPLRYEKKQGRGYLIYSIGRDLRDDGGRPEDKGKGDLTFEVRR